MTTNVPVIQFTPAGVVLPPTSAVLAGVTADINGAFGNNLNPDGSTPQGQLATSETAAIVDKNAQIAFIVNQVDPDQAETFMQDAIGRIYFQERIAGTPTAVQCPCGGAQGTIIPVGAQAADTSGNRYVAMGAGEIDSTGMITLPFANITNGPIPCPANTLTKIYQAIPGWETINNPGAGIVGADVESRADFEFRRQQSVALNGHGSILSIGANVSAVPGVIDSYAIENDENTTVNTGSTNFPLVAHSLYVAVVGGADADVANAIWDKKDVGCDYNGNTSVVVFDTSYSQPQPQYTVKFERAAALAIKFAIQIASSPNLPANIVALTQAAVIAAFTGADGSTRVRIASLLLAAKFYGPVVALGPGVSVLSILLGSSTPTLTSQQIGIDQAPTVQASDIDVTLV